MSRDGTSLPCNSDVLFNEKHFQAKRRATRINGILVGLMAIGMMLASPLALVTNSATLPEAAFGFVIGAVILWFSIRYVKCSSE